MGRWMSPHKTIVQCRRIILKLLRSTMPKTTQWKQITSARAQTQNLRPKLGPCFFTTRAIQGSLWPLQIGILFCINCFIRCHSSEATLLFSSFVELPFCPAKSGSHVSVPSNMSWILIHVIRIQLDQMVVPQKKKKVMWLHQSGNE